MAKKVVIDFEARLAKFEQSIQKATAKLNNFSSNARTRSAELSSAFTSMAGKVAGVFTLGKVAGDFSEINRQIGSLQASLMVLTGSAAETDAVMQRMQQFVSGLPISIAEATQAFVRMRAYGLDPTEEAILSFANTASVVNKPLEQFIDAVADAAIGQFERLNEFGIKASRQDDKVAFIFQGVTTTVKNNAEEIQRYLESIGNTTFAGAIEAQAQTWEGAMRRMSNAWDGFLLTVSRTGVADKATEFVGRVASFVERASGGLKLISGDANDAQQAAAITREIERLEKVQAGLLAKANEEPGFFGRLFGDAEGQLERVTRRLEELREIRQTLLSKAQPTGGAGGGDEGINTDKSVSALDKLRQALDSANGAAAQYKETVKLLQKKRADPFEKATTDASKVAKTYSLLGDALSSVRAGDIDAAADIEAAAEAVNRLQAAGLVAAQTIKDMKQALAGAIAPPKDAETKIVIKTEIDDQGLVTYTDEATKKAQAAANANPVIIPIKPVLIDGSGSRFLDQIPEFGGGFDIEAEKYGTKR